GPFLESPVLSGQFHRRRADSQVDHPEILDQRQTERPDTVGVDPQLADEVGRDQHAVQDQRGRPSPAPQDVYYILRPAAPKSLVAAPTARRTERRRESSPPSGIAYR